MFCGGCGSQLRELWFAREQRRHERHARDAVHQRVVHLGDDRDLAIGNLLDDVHLPQRQAAIERMFREAGGELR
jgi:hypothetical protein